MERKLTVTWDDPLIGAETSKTMTGLDYLRAIESGDIPPPPIARLLGFRLTRVDLGQAVFELEPGEHHYNPIGMVHGGVASTVLDSAMGCAVHSTLPAGTGYSTVELKINFIRPLSTDTGKVLCEARVIHSGGRIATAEGKLADKNGKLYAHGTTTCLIFRS
ncbi:MAG: PaaI family thioesterase [Deltaproteobacteria bacterium]|nr:MAG: PaaI family thioesterase [Deltaproteobacteria bacterium]